jgi:menaquinol-cytochrome c reductase iron-sulfur subunit
LRIVHPTSPPDDSRRTFLKWATNGIGAIFAVVLGVPAVAYVIDPRNRPKPPADLHAVSGVRLSEVGADPVQGVVREVRYDAWTFYPNDVLGRVWVRRIKPGKEKDCYIVLSTVCPHLGCSVNANANQAADPGFTCPCHVGRFTADGALAAVDPGPPPRGMDHFDFDVVADPANPDPENRDQLLVKFEVFRQGVPEAEKKSS